MTNQIETIHLDAVLKNHGQDMSSKTIAITGTTSGTGFIAARELAKLGAEVILLNRDSSRAEKSLEDLKKLVPGGRFVQISCDLQNFESVRNAVAQVLEKYNQLDILINNAGVMALEDYATTDGYDVQMQTNVLSHFLISKGLFQLLKKSSDGRIVNHTSMARLGGPLEPKYFGPNGGNLGGDNSAEGMMSGPRWERYHQSKLSNFIFTYALKQKLESAGVENVITLVAHPGFAATNLQVTTAESGGLELSPEMMSQAQSAEDGATGILRAAIDPESKSGEFYGPEGWKGYPDIRTPEADLVTQQNIDIFWEGCEAAVGSFEI